MPPAVLLLLMAINCLGVRAGGTVQSGLMVLKILAIAMLVLAGWWFAPANPGFVNANCDRRKRPA